MPDWRMVAIIGAGVSGLACARALAGSGIDSVVLEAKDVPGGRVRTYRPPDAGPVLELGAQVIHGNLNPLHDLALLGLGVSGAGAPRAHRVPRERADVILGGRPVSMGTLTRGGAAPWDVEQRLVVGADADMPVATWLAEQGISGADLDATLEWFRQTWAAQPRALSVRGVATARRRDRVGTGEYAFEDGFASLTRELAAGVDIRLGRPVRSVKWATGQADIGFAEGAGLRAKAVIVTVPPTVVAREALRLEPLPVRKAAAAAALRAGDGCCEIAVLSHPAPESRVVFDADGHSGFVRCTAGRPQVLVVAKATAAAAVRAGDPARRVAQALPWASRCRLTAWHRADWGLDPWSGGAFSYPGVGTLWAAPAWAAPLDRTVFFAGEATTAGLLPPSVHGAIGSGLRAAREVVQAWSN